MVQLYKRPCVQQEKAVSRRAGWRKFWTEWAEINVAEDDWKLSVNVNATSVSEWAETDLSFILCDLLCVLSLWVPTWLESGTKKPFQENEEDVSESACLQSVLPDIVNTVIFVKTAEKWNKKLRSLVIKPAV